ncbi:MAG: hypothetical protein NTY01_21670 [Verrucomicrobia bacterium]|nr:hypothetical protein [Verrucomicrobiota bacterium]
MRTTIILAVTALLSSSVFAQDAAVSLKPGAVIQFTFPDLPPTLYAQAKNDPVPAKLTARLPDNYTPEGRWPLFVFLAGGVGAKGDDASMARKLIGPRDFIAVSMPLFQRVFDPKQYLGGVAITVDDFETLRSAYRTMLGKLMKAVPGIVPKRSTLGGSSNGGHATALLIAGGDEFTLEHFRQFYFVDGGAQFLAPFGFNALAPEKHRLLLLRADQPHPVSFRPGQPPWNARESLDKIFDAVTDSAKARGLDWTQVVMRGRKHGFEPEFHVVVGQWARDEKMDEVPPKPAAPQPVKR